MGTQRMTILVETTGAGIGLGDLQPSDIERYVTSCSFRSDVKINIEKVETIEKEKGEEQIGLESVLAVVNDYRLSYVVPPPDLKAYIFTEEFLKDKIDDLERLRLK